MMQESTTIAANDGDFIIASPKRYNWKPKEDITAYELALVMPLFVSHYYDIEQLMKDLPESARRHFEEALAD